MKVWLLTPLVLLGGLAGCGSSSSVSCGDGIFCPADTSCSAEGICLVETNSCPDFQLNSACLDADGQIGYCSEAGCEPSVFMTGMIGDFGNVRNDGLEGVEVSVIEQPWVKPIITLTSGVFTLPVRSGDPSVTLGAKSEGTMKMRTRSFAVGDELFEVNADIQDSIALITEDRIDMLHGFVGVERSLDNGLVLLKIGRCQSATGEVGCGVADISASLRSAPVTAAYFDGIAVQEGATTSTENTTGIAFFAVPPGTYDLVLDHPETTCFGRGLDRPVDIQVVVTADTMTNLGTISCILPGASTLEAPADSN